MQSYLLRSAQGVNLHCPLEDLCFWNSEFRIPGLLENLCEQPSHPGEGGGLQHSPVGVGSRVDPGPEVKRSLVKERAAQTWTRSAILEPQSDSGSSGYF